MKDRIKAIRSMTGLSQAKFAAAYDIPRRTLENWECGINEPPEYVVTLLARCVSIDYEKNGEKTRL